MFEAREITSDDPPGFEVSVFDDLECDQEVLFARLDAKIRKAIFACYLESESDFSGRKRIRLKKDEVVGRFVYDENVDGIHSVVIDGKLITWEELGRMMEPFEGFQFQLKIFEASEDF